ncbi:hypothetical protein HDV01_004344 [Terramyces sp. JEL0728]|nr:hypothetical protein HDV01_004344 [Terramyces sp. JEL0728]
MIHATISRNILLAFILTLVYGIYYYQVECCEQAVTITGVTSRGSPFPDNRFDFLYKHKNGTFTVISVDSYNPEIGGTTTVNLPFPEKINGEYMKVGPDRKIADGQIVYYKHGRNIYKNSINGEEIVYELPKRGRVELHAIGSYTDILFVLWKPLSFHQ